jgi:hypothetical protein
VVGVGVGVTEVEGDAAVGDAAGVVLAIGDGGVVDGVTTGVADEGVAEGVGDSFELQLIAATGNSSKTDKIVNNRFFMLTF